MEAGAQVKTIALEGLVDTPQNVDTKSHRLGVRLMGCLTQASALPTTYWFAAKPRTTIAERR